jgi:phosphoglycerate dehydrogenase-like enzyme
VLVPDDLATDLGREISVADWEVVLFDARLGPAQTGIDADALVTFDTPVPVLSAYARTATRLRLVQALSAGVDAVVAAGFGEQVEICSGRGLHDVPVTEHALALLLAAARALPAAARAQREHRWATELGGRQPLRDPQRFSTLIGAHVAIWGYGSIGRTLADRLRLLGAHVTGVTRSGGEPATVGTDGLSDLLPTLDALVLVLPSTAETHHVVDASILSALPRRAWVVNVGRGSVIDESALIAALDRGEISGAALDVFATEPLPGSSPLWEHPGVLITPHAAGGRPIGAAALIEDNLSRLARGTQLRNRVPRRADVSG